MLIHCSVVTDPHNTFLALHLLLPPHPSTSPPSHIEVQPGWLEPLMNYMKVGGVKGGEGRGGGGGGGIEITGSSD